MLYFAAHLYFLVEMEEKEAHKLDKYLDHLNPMLHRPLGKKDAEMMEKYLKIFSWRCKLLSPEKVRQKIRTEFDVSYSWACEMYNDMEYIFGNTDEINKNTHRRVLLEHYYKAIRLVETSKNKDSFKAAEIIIKATDRIAVLLGIGDTSEQIPPELLMPKRSVTYYVGTMNVQQIEGPNAVPLPPITIPIEDERDN